MSISKPIIRYLVKSHKNSPIEGNILTLGRQFIFSDLKECIKIFEVEGCRINIPDQRDVHYQTISNEEKHVNFIDDNTFFKLFNKNLNIKSLDISDYQGASIIQNLNVPIMEDLKGQFDFIMDGGTLEHIFDIRQCIENINLMLKPGGRVIHINPINGYLDHGFFQLSPSLFNAYYSLNKFKVINCFLIRNPIKKINYRKWEFFHWEQDKARKVFISKRPLMIIFEAQKTNESLNGIIPIEEFIASQRYASSRKPEEYPWGLEKLLDYF